MPADAPDMAESSIPSELPTSIPSPEESTQNILPQITLNPCIDESNKIHDSDRCIALKYSQRSNKGVPKKQYEPNPKLRLNTQLATMCLPINCLDRMHLLLINYHCVYS